MAGMRFNSAGISIADREEPKWSVAVAPPTVGEWAFSIGLLVAAVVAGWAVLHYRLDQIIFRAFF